LYQNSSCTIFIIFCSTDNSAQFRSPLETVEQMPCRKHSRAVHLNQPKCSSFN